MTDFGQDHVILKDWLKLFEEEVNHVFEELKKNWTLCYSPDSGAFNREYSERSVSENRVELIRAMQYSSGGGKRIRPLIMASSYLAAGGRNILENKTLIKFAISLEFIHSYSLIHDDLPALDNDDLRRGKASCHIKFGEDMAIIAGDGLLNLSYELAAGALKDMTREDLKKGIEALESLSKLAGIGGMIGGQAMDLTDEVLTSHNLIKMMVEKKTCALFMAAGRIGGILAGADNEKIKNLTSFAYNLGMAFQLRDDELDGEEDKESGKITLYNSFTNKEERDSVKKLTDQALNYIESLENKKVLTTLAGELINRNY